MASLCRLVKHGTKKVNKGERDQGAPPFKR
jgi:hypothetical protein